MKLFLNDYISYGVLFSFCVIIFLAHYFISGQAVYGDGIGYYAHLRSWFMDGDWDYTNEYKHIYNHENNNSPEPVSTDKVQIVATTATGQAENHYSPGIAILLFPFFWVAHFITVATIAFGNSVSVTGYSDIYQITTGIGAICYLVFSVWILEQIIKHTTEDDEVARLTAFTIFFGTQLLYYGSFDVINSHFASFFLMVTFFYVDILKKKSLENIFLLGLIAGLLTVNRLQDGVIALLWIVFSLQLTNIKIFLTKISVFVGGFILGLWPLLYHWHNTFGSFVEQTYIRNLMSDFSTQGFNLLGSFFNPVTGLFVKAPILLVILLYFFLVREKERNRYVTLAFIFFCIQIIIITIQGGWYAAAYGGRMYISSLLFFALILGDLYLFLKNKNEKAPYLLAAVAIILNFISFAYFIFIQK